MGSQTIQLSSPPRAASSILAASSGNVANASAVATLTPGTGLRAYLQHVTVSGAGATAGSVVSMTVTGLMGGTQTFNIEVPAGVTTGIGASNAGVINFDFGPSGAGLPGAAINTAIVVTVPAFGSGNTNAAVNANGFQSQ